MAVVTAGTVASGYANSSRAAAHREASTLRPGTVATVEGGPCREDGWWLAASTGQRLTRCRVSVVGVRGDEGQRHSLLKNHPYRGWGDVVRQHGA